jgi:hypothetical protein
MYLESKWRLTKNTLIYLLPPMIGALTFTYQLIFSIYDKNEEFARYYSIISMINIIGLSIGVLQNFTLIQGLSSAKNKSKIGDSNFTKKVLISYVTIFTLIIIIMQIADYEYIQIGVILILLFNTIISILTSILFGKIQALGKFYITFYISLIMSAANLAVLIVLIIIDKLQTQYIFTFQIIIGLVVIIQFSQVYGNKVVIVGNIFNADFLIKSIYLIIIWLTISLDVILNPIFNNKDTADFAKIMLIPKAGLYLLIIIIGNKLHSIYKNLTDNHTDNRYIRNLIIEVTKRILVITLVTTIITKPLLLLIYDIQINYFTTRYFEVILLIFLEMSLYSIAMIFYLSAQFQEVAVISIINSLCLFYLFSKEGVHFDYIKIIIINVFIVLFYIFVKKIDKIRL